MMDRSHRTPPKTTGFFRRKFRGLSLLEAMLALGIGGIVIVQSVFGLSEYSSGLQVQATASKLSILNRAADSFAEDNFSNLVAAAPQELSIDVLEPYTGDNIGKDAFGNNYKLSTRTYQITVPDPATGGTKNETALQVLIVGTYDPSNTVMTEDLTLRSDVANASGSAAGFIASGAMTCTNGSGGTRGNGGICGAFGSYSISDGSFSATDFSNAALVSLVTKGDSSVYGDQLYRYDYGDPELNTMHTSLYMDNNVIQDPDAITGIDHMLFDANDSVIESESGARLAVRSAEDLRLQARGGEVNINSSTNDYVLRYNSQPATGVPCSGNPCTDQFVKLGPTNNRLRITSNETVFGDKNPSVFHGNMELRTGTGAIWAGIARIEDPQVRQLNSLFQASDDVLRLQRNRNWGEVMIGKRARYNPDGSGGIYELSDGDLTAQHIQVQDITCADCGGSLSAILPKWRHMGTYYIPDSTTRQVPKPNCGDNRTNPKVRDAIGNNLAYADSNSDGRYEAKIILVPRQFAFRDAGGNTVGEMNFRFRASDQGSVWLTQADVTRGAASALAQTYCVFVGGNPDPTAAKANIDHGSTNSNIYFNRIE